MAESPPEIIKLDANVLTFDIGGFVFSADVVDANAILAKEVDAKHAGEQGCEFLDTVIATLKTWWGVPKCTRGAAWGFYDTVTKRMDALKKTILTMPESDIGSASIAEVGPEPSSESDSKTSPDAMPSEISASMI